jgi:aryl-alcohol dehydrogenase-like predicted oxidoreductase
MRYRKLGRTGFEVSEIGHGLWGMGDWTGVDESSYLGVLQQSAGLGCTFFDTAWAYGQGKSDGLAGELLRANAGKARLYVASKVPPKNAKWPASPADAYEDVFPQAYVLESADRIRRALAMDRIDLLQFHVWDDGWADEPAFVATVEKLKRDGIIAAFGLSLNRWEPWNGLKALRTGCVDTVQVIYNVFDQAPEDQLFPLCREMNIGVIARVPLDEGSLGGGLTLDTTFPANDWRSGYFGPANLAPTVERVERLKAILPPGMTLPEMALRFILSNPDVSTTIVGMRTAGHLRENLGVSDKGPLPPDLLSELKRHRWDRKVAPWAA